MEAGTGDGFANEERNSGRSPGITQNLAYARCSMLMNVDKPLDEDTGEYR